MNILKHLWTALFEPLLYIIIMLFLMLLIDELNREVSTCIPDSVFSHMLSSKSLYNTMWL